MKAQTMPQDPRWATGIGCCTICTQRWNSRCSNSTPLGCRPAGASSLPRQRSHLPYETVADAAAAHKAFAPVLTCQQLGLHLALQIETHVLNTAGPQVCKLVTCTAHYRQEEKWRPAVSQASHSMPCQQWGLIACTDPGVQLDPGIQGGWHIKAPACLQWDLRPALQCQK